MNHSDKVLGFFENRLAISGTINCKMCGATNSLKNEKCEKCREDLHD